ncbi:uncharacterized protein LOC141860648 [Acropora palmata]
MESCSKPAVKALSIAQIVISAAFFLLSIVDGFYIQLIHVNLTLLPCWIAVLVLPLGVMGLALSCRQTLRSLQLLKDAIWSLCVVCIICSALTMHIYTARGLLYMEYYALPDKSPDCWSTRKDAGIFVSKGDKIAYTEKEKAALAVFTFVVICSVTEIVLAVAMMKISETATPQLCSSCGRYDEMGERQQNLMEDPVGQQQVHVVEQGT